jgi:hypothetical protein
LVLGGEDWEIGQKYSVFDRAEGADVSLTYGRLVVCDVRCFGRESDAQVALLNTLKMLRRVVSRMEERHVATPGVSAFRIISRSISCGALKVLWVDAVERRRQTKRVVRSSMPWVVVWWRLVLTYHLHFLMRGRWTSRWLVLLLCGMIARRRSWWRREIVIGLVHSLVLDLTPTGRRA